MPNPWLNLPLADYETHMSSENVQQLTALSDLFAIAIDLRRPQSLAILGIAGGNGLDRIDPQLTSRTVGIDINTQYLNAVQTRYAHLPGLELHRIDLAENAPNIAPVDLVHAALIFEHAGTDLCLDHALSLVADGGSFSVVLQLPGNPGQDIGNSGYASMKSLSSNFKLIDPKSFSDRLAANHFTLSHQSECSLPAGKKFWMGIFNRP